MDRVNRNINLNNEKIELLKKYFNREEVIMTVYLFGSYGTVDETILSDLDLAVLYNKRVTLFKEMQISASIEFIIEKTLKTYFDYGITLRKFQDDFRQGIREEYLDGYR